MVTYLMDYSIQKKVFLSGLWCLKNVLKTFSDNVQSNIHSAFPYPFGFWGVWIEILILILVIQEGGM